MTIPCKSSKKTYQIPVNPLKLHCLLLLVSAAPPPPPNELHICCGGRKPSISYQAPQEWKGGQGIAEHPCNRNIPL